MADLRASGLGGVPKGETADRPASPSIGDVFYNGTLGVLEIYRSTGWQTIGSPDAPTSVSATAGSAVATVSFTAPTNVPVTSYTVTSSPGNITATGSSSPITVTG